ncbi:putative carbonic anhydrase [Rosellinia necatrix]|uniref:carbonic anhydrase n=1 Tax=Rosellinia necatrix TaxID=77044 RepID=A0A1W2TGB5_ROSNE|nr:putative carbonic anhydrase [Rosellinia necatrix]
MAPIPRSLLFLAAAVTPAFGFCGSRTHLDKREAGETVPTATFGYFGAGGPVLWHHLSAANELCASGTNQSPINMVQGSFTLSPASDLAVSLPDTVAEGATFENLGSTIEVVMEGQGGTLQLDDVEYELLQFHFHHPSEHVDNGVSMPMEMHMVFSAGTQLAVIGVYIDLVDGANATGLRRRAAASTMLETIFASIDDIATPGNTTKTAPFQMTELTELLATTEFQRYSGSLTTPPCSEGVSWSVPTKKLSLSRATFIKVRDVVGFNSRFPQNTPGMANILAMVPLA